MNMKIPKLLLATFAAVSAGTKVDNSIIAAEAGTARDPLASTAPKQFHFHFPF